MNDMTVNRNTSETRHNESDVALQQTDNRRDKSHILARIRNNLMARRHLLAVITFVIVFFSVFAEISWPIVLAGYATMASALALLPRLDMLRPLVAVRRVQHLKSVEPTEYQALINAMPTPSIMLNSHGALLFINKEASDLFPLAKQKQHISSFVRDPDFLDAVTNAIKSEKDLEINYHIRVPIERYLSVKVAPLHNVKYGSENPALLVSLRDLTEQERLSQMRSDFVANASHELRTPLASVLGFIDTLQGPAKNDEKARGHFLLIMREQIERMARLIDDLLSLSRLEMVAHLTPDDQVDLTEVVEYVITILEPIAESTNTQVLVESKLEVADVRGTRDELIQLFQNLIQNSIKYGKNNGTIKIKIEKAQRSSKADPMVAVTVSDDGPGIAAKHIPRLTERFYRIDNDISRKRGGTGLGLAIVKHIVTRHRGELKIESTPGIGSRFKIYLPDYTSQQNKITKN